ncbi:TPA: UDP binding domain-containing protein, partial [Streptococcus pneumoniae]
MKNNFLSRIQNKKANITIWGAGYIGLSTAYHFALVGFRVKIFDTNHRLIQNLLEGNLPFKIDLDEEIFSKLIFNKSILPEVVEHADTYSDEIQIICINTERNGVPISRPLTTVLDNITTVSEQLVIVESTISPNWIDTIIRPKLNDLQYLTVAPRRDWFLETGLNLKTLPRVIGTLGSNYRMEVLKLYEMLSDVVIEVTDAYHACLVKAVENSIRYINVVFANEMMRAFPRYNMAEIFDAASTKWNIPYYHPSIGIGGYCLPLAPKYILDAVNDSEELPMLRESVKSDLKQSDFITDLIKSYNCQKVGVLGLSYAPETKIWKNSPVVSLIYSLLRNGIEVKINDPYFSSEEIQEITTVQSFSLNSESLQEFDILVIA